MRLDDFLEANEISSSEFATSVGVTRQAVDRYRNRRRIPDPKVMVEIFKATRGEVRPDDFYDLTNLQKQKARRTRKTA